MQNAPAAGEAGTQKAGKTYGAVKQLLLQQAMSQNYILQTYARIE